MKMARILTSAILLTVATWCSLLSADPRTRILARIDQNGDGLIDHSEFKAPHRRGPGSTGSILNRADTDNDGNISRAELEAMKTTIKEHARASLERRTLEVDTIFSEADSNGDQLVSTEELRMLAFKRMDANSDGFISIEEMRKPERPMMDQRSPRSGRPHLKHRPTVEPE